jgi:hypothetical protein
VQARCGSSSEAAPRTGDDGNAPRKISVFHAENCSPSLSSVSVRQVIVDQTCEWNRTAHKPN